MREPITLADCKAVLNYMIPQINGEDLVDRQELNDRLETWLEESKNIVD